MKVNPISSKTFAIFCMIMFCDFVALFMVAPMFTPILLKGTHFISPETKHLFKTFSSGFLIAIYGLGQFFGGPILGELSDQFGRKRTLIGAIIIFCVGNVFSALMILANNLILFFLSRLIVGFASGTASILFAAVSSASQSDKERGERIGYLIASCSLGIILGPIFGTQLSQASYGAFFSLETPFWILALVSLINICLLGFFYLDTGSYLRRDLQLFTGISNIIECARCPLIGKMMLSFLLFVLGTESIFIGLPIYAVLIFHVSSVWLGWLFAWEGAWSAFGSGFLNKQLGEKLSPEKIYLLGNVLLFIAYLAFLIVDNAVWLYIPFMLV